MDANCSNCKFYQPINHRGQRHPKGKCLQHTARRMPDGYEINLSIFSPYEFICDLHEPVPQPIYALDGHGEPMLIPPVMAADLQKQGWVLVKMEGHNITAIRKDE